MSPNKPLAVVSEGLIDSLSSGELKIYLYRSQPEMAMAAASAVVLEIARLIAERGRAVGIFAAAFSNGEIYDRLVAAPQIQWTRVIAFHPGEYLGVDEHSPHSSRRFLIERFVKRVPLAEFHPLRGEAANPEAVCQNYAALLGARAPDFALLDIGDDGRLTYQTPSVCGFEEPALVKVVDSEVDGLPCRAISLTMRTIMACRRLFAVASGASKRRAVYEATEGEMAAACPASILRAHPDASLFIESQAAGMLTAVDWGSES
jgi:glucosamine-6-phosphate deaminase